MNHSLEIKALGLAALTALISLGGALLTAIPIKMVMASSALQGQTTAPSLPPEIATSPALIQQGRQFYTMSCLECHGDNAHGDEGPDLHNLPISNASIVAKIKKGVKGEMPSFSKKYDDVQVTALVFYLRTLR